MRGKLTTGKLSYIINPYKGAELGIPVAFEKKMYQVGLKTGVTANILKAKEGYTIQNM